MMSYELNMKDCTLSVWIVGHRSELCQSRAPGSQGTNDSQSNSSQQANAQTAAIRFAGGVRYSD